eukprot:4211899-Prymnesium_polylepis.1
MHSRVPRFQPTSKPCPRRASEPSCTRTSARVAAASAACCRAHSMSPSLLRITNFISHCDGQAVRMAAEPVADIVQNISDDLLDGGAEPHH